MRPRLPAGLHNRVRPSTVVLMVAFVAVFALWVVVRAPDTGPAQDRFTPLGAAASAAHLHFDPTPTPTPTPTAASHTAPAHKPGRVNGGAKPARSAHAHAGGS